MAVPAVVTPTTSLKAITAAAAVPMRQAAGAWVNPAMQRSLAVPAGTEYQASTLLQQVWGIARVFAPRYSGGLDVVAELFLERKSTRPSTVWAPVRSRVTTCSS